MLMLKDKVDAETSVMVLKSEGRREQGEGAGIVGTYWDGAAEEQQDCTGVLSVQCA